MNIQSQRRRRPAPAARARNLADEEGDVVHGDDAKVRIPIEASWRCPKDGAARTPHRDVEFGVALVIRLKGEAALRHVGGARRCRWPDLDAAVQLAGLRTMSW
jgi:hypothetical protein